MELQYILERITTLKKYIQLYVPDVLSSIIEQYNVLNLTELDEHMKKYIIQSLIHVSHIKVHDNILFLCYFHIRIASMEYKSESLNEPMPCRHELYDMIHSMHQYNNKKLNKAVYSVLDVLSMHSDKYRYSKCNFNHLIHTTNKQTS
jgi:hypothetical protein